jgi:hypothetical protein
MKKEKKKTVIISEDAFVALGIAMAEAKESLGKKCEYCGCYGGIHKSNCILMLKLK